MESQPPASDTCPFSASPVSSHLTVAGSVLTSQIPSVEIGVLREGDHVGISKWPGGPDQSVRICR